MGLPDFFNADKEIAQFPNWSEPEQGTNAIWFAAPLSINGVVEESFTLHGIAVRNVPDRHVTFELRIAGPKTRKIPIARFDWKSLQGGHSNRRTTGSPVSGRRVPATHYHSFELNWLPNTGRMRGGNLPQAESVLEDLQSFESLRAHIAKLFRINNMLVVTVPPWEYDLFGHG